MPHESVIVREDVISSKGMHDIVLQERYEAPAGPNAEVAFDIHSLKR
jgi:hypothetical protein